MTGEGETAEKQVSLIAAIAANGVIGRDGGLPWKLPTDLARFKRLTMGHSLIMGRRTFASIGRALPGRDTVVMTRGEWSAEGVRVAHSVEEALLATADRMVFVAGGGDVYRAFLARADRLDLTRIEAEVDGDTRFPPFDEREFELLSDEPHAAEAGAPFTYRFQVWLRRR